METSPSDRPRLSRPQPASLELHNREQERATSRTVEGTPIGDAAQSRLPATRNEAAPRVRAAAPHFSCGANLLRIGSYQPQPCAAGVHGVVGDLDSVQKQ